MITAGVSRFKKAVVNSEVATKAYSLKLRKFRPKVNINFERKDFLVKTVENHFELKQVLRLRYEVFLKEQLHRDSLVHYEMDKFDKGCDHLIVIDKKKNRVIGSYRFLSSTFSNNFYSENEFEIEEIKKLDSIKMELGRACVHRDYRNGSTITLLWLGMVEYIKSINAKYMFGCSSIKTTNALEASLIYKYFVDSGVINTAYNVRPTASYRIDQLDENLAILNSIDADTSYAKKIVPPLVKSYIKAGAVICGEPAYDPDFKCIDFFTLLDADLINAKHRKKFGSDRKENKVNC